MQRMKSKMTRRSIFAALLAPVVAPAVAALAPVHKETLADKWAKQIEIQKLFDPRYYRVPVSKTIPMFDWWVLAGYHKITNFDPSIHNVPRCSNYQIRSEKIGVFPKRMV